MCSVGDDVEDEKSKFMQTKTSVNLKGSVCIKCRTANPQVVLQSQYPYCKQCFLSATVHKFKAVLGKNRIVSPNENVLVYHKCGHASTALLHFLRTGLDLTTPKKIRFKPVLLFVENNSTLSYRERLNILKDVDEEAKRFDFEIHYISLSSYIADSNKLSSIIVDNYENILTTDKDCTSSDATNVKKPNLTTKTELIKLHEKRLLLDVAKFLNCKCIFTTDLGIDIASQLLTNICLGRGEHVAFDTGTIDTRDDEVTIMRPLRNFSIKEIAFYNFFTGLHPIFINRKNKNPYASVQNLMEKFVSNLQENYPATVSTIVRTGDKLGTNKEIVKKCLLCQVPLGINSETLGSSEATNFSHWVSTQTPNCDESVVDRSKYVLETFDNTIYENYCFSCNQIKPFLLLHEVRVIYINSSKLECKCLIIYSSYFTDWEVQVKLFPRNI